MHSLYPAIKPYKTHQLAVGKPHILYVEETGNPKGLPVIVLHSGPGAGADAHLRRFFDPEVYRIILFDQRGCGRSTPHVELHNNSTSHLLEDIDTIRNFLKIDRFSLFGVGWGALLALLYAQSQPQLVSALLLQQVFLGRKKDINWLFSKGANLIYPDHWQEFINMVPIEQQANVLKYYLGCLKGDNEVARMSAAKNWALWQAHCSSLHPHHDRIEQLTEPHYALALATLEAHYLDNHYFLDDEQIIINSYKISHIPVYLIHGRYDMISPLANAWELHQVLPASQLSIVRDAGHSDLETGIIDAIITASKEISLKGLA